jgi:hypothetical protein
MPVTVSLLDETTSGECHAAGTLACDSGTLTLRELIRLRVQQEVERFNQSDTKVFRGLLEPHETERLLNPERPSHRRLDWETQFATAIAAFRTNGFVVLVDDAQVTDLDERLDLRPETKVTFLKLVPLIGG